MKDLEGYPISSRLDAEGQYRLYVSGQLVAGARIDQAEPLDLRIPTGHRPPSTSSWAELKFAGQGLPEVFPAGMAALIVGPLDNGGNTAAEVRFGAAPPAEKLPGLSPVPNTNLKVVD